MGFKSIINNMVKNAAGSIQKMVDKAAHDKMVDDSLGSTEYKRLTAADVLKEKEEEKRKGFKKGGYVKAADGCAKRGKTKGRMV